MSIAGKLTRDGWLLFATRCSRMFAYGLLLLARGLKIVYDVLLYRAFATSTIRSEAK